MWFNEMVTFLGDDFMWIICLEIRDASGFYRLWGSYSDVSFELKVTQRLFLALYWEENGTKLDLCTSSSNVHQQPCLDQKLVTPPNVQETLYVLRSPVLWFCGGGPPPCWLGLPCSTWPTSVGCAEVAPTFWTLQACLHYSHLLLALSALYL